MLVTNCTEMGNTMYGNAVLTLACSGTLSLSLSLSLCDTRNFQALLLVSLTRLYGVRTGILAQSGHDFILEERSSSK